MSEKINVNVTNLQFGDVLLYSSKSPQSIFKKLEEELGPFISELIYQQSGQKYIYQELLLQGRYTLQQVPNGVYILKKDLDDFQYMTVRRHKEINKVSKEQFFNVIKKYWNLPFDFTSLSINIISGIFQQFPIYEKTVQEILDKLSGYDTKELLISSEMIQRIYDDLGLKCTDEKQEFVSPQNLQDSPYFETIFETDFVD